MPRAPRRCPGNKGNCDNLIRGSERYCPEHTVAWAGQRTTSGTTTGTTAWKKLRLEVLERDNYRCQVEDTGCAGRATQVDHITNTAAGGAPLDPNNCQAICAPCNARKAQRESAATKRRKR